MNAGWLCNIPHYIYMSDREDVMFQEHEYDFWFFYVSFLEATKMINTLKPTVIKLRFYIYNVRLKSVMIFSCVNFAPLFHILHAHHLNHLIHSHVTQSPSPLSGRWWGLDRVRLCHSRQSVISSEEAWVDCAPLLGLTHWFSKGSHGRQTNDKNKNKNMKLEQKQWTTAEAKK